MFRSPLMLPRIGWISTCLLLQTCGLPQQVAAPLPPNIIVIMADDLGYGDLGCYGHATLATPHIDDLAARGLLFRDFHSNGVNCSPTRAALMTGRYQQRSGISGVVTAKSHRHTGLALEEVTFADLLQAQGYSTAIFGKWHLGYAPEFNPVHQGFERYAGFVSGNVDYISHIDQVGEVDWWSQDQLQPEEGYSTDLITDHGVRYVQQHAGGPFCLYLAHESPHYPYQGRADPPGRSPGKPGSPKQSQEERVAAYHEMIAALDDGVGRIVAAVREAGIERRTLIFFCSDNGPSGPGSSGGLRGRKGQVWEGGHRVPAIACWPGSIAPGARSHQTVLGMDLMPTLAAMGQAPIPAGLDLDGLNLLPHLLSAQALPERTLCWEFKGRMALRQGPWKLVRTGDKTQLFQLDQDPAEEHDQSESQPERAQQLTEELDAWYRSVTADVQMRS